MPLLRFRPRISCLIWNRKRFDSAVLPQSPVRPLWLWILWLRPDHRDPAKFTAKAGVDQRSYGITVKEKYDSPEFKNAEESIIVDIPVKQYARLSISNIDVMPDTMSVGSESNVMFGINNTGKVILYNVNVTFEGDSIKPVDTYVGQY